MSDVAVTFEFLLRGHIEGKKGAFPKNGLHLLLESIHAAWNEKKTATLILLDVTGAFDNVIQPCFLYNLCKRKIDDPMLQWINGFLQDRTTTLKLVDFTLSQLSVNKSLLYLVLFMRLPF